MNRTIFYQWVLRFNAAFAATRHQREQLLLDIASCHGTGESVLELFHVDIHFLAKKTTAILQLMNAGVIASVEKRYKREQAKKAVVVSSKGCAQKCIRCQPAPVDYLDLQHTVPIASTYR